LFRSFTSNIQDLIAAATFMESHYHTPEILIGHSLGGSAVIQAAHRIGTGKAVATIGAPATPEHVKKNFGADLEQINARGKAEVTLAGRNFTIKKQFIDDLEENHMDSCIQKLDRALMIFNSPVDNNVGIKNAEKIYRKARHLKSDASPEDADHLLIDKKDNIYVAEIMASWAIKYV